MNKYYSQKRFVYKTDSENSFKLSRTKLDLSVECPRCFYLDQRLGIKRPSGPPFLLNSAVDHLLKQEFDIYRANGDKHPLLEKYGVEAKPVPHKDLDKWRHNFTGVQFHHKKTNFLLYGAIDDLWQGKDGNYIVVDYKATSKNEPASTAEDLWPGFLTQVEVYQWLLRQNGYKVSDTGYFVNCNAFKDRKAFDAKLEFDVVLIPYKGDDSWVEKAVLKAHGYLNSDNLPESGEGCEYCKFKANSKEVEN